MEEPRIKNYVVQQQIDVIFDPSMVEYGLEITGGYVMICH